MKTFIEYLTEETKKKAEPKKHLQPFETVFGSHSKEKSEKHYQPFETVFGSHSKKHVKEDVLEEAELEALEEASKSPGDDAKSQIQEHDNATQTSIHKKSALSNSWAVRDYTGGSAGLNGHLHAKYRKKLGLPHNKNDIYANAENKKKSLDKELDKASFPHDTHVFTGLPHSPHHAFKHTGTKGTSVKVHMPAYTSTSTSFKSARKFAQEHDTDHDLRDNHKPLNTDAKVKGSARHVLKLHIPKGTKAGSVKNLSYYSHENEILLHRGHNIEIHHRPTVMKDGTHVWHARVISHTPHD